MMKDSKETDFDVMEAEMNGVDRLLVLEKLTKYFRVSSGGAGKHADLKAVDGVSLEIPAGETLGLVGESGCGKSTLAKLILGLYRPTKGNIFFEGREISRDGRVDWKEIRRRIQIIFQDPYSSLNARMNVGSILAEPFIIHGLADKKEIGALVERLLLRVGLSSEARWRYPHEFSGGQRQRIGIARSLALEPRLIIADEPVSSLDVSIRAQILNLLMDLREEMGMAYLFISHDLSVIRHISDRVAVMYLGRIVEEGPVRELFEKPLHPYTEALLEAIPEIDRRRGKSRIILKGDIPSPVNPPTGCYFHTRCRIRGDGCDSAYPEYRESTRGHFIACHYRG